jgi:ABC-type bacteriocin/lantibiotic exporter with double-glycine peptidase domain
MATRLEVPFVWQKKMMECWYACMQMLLQYADGKKNGKMKSQAPTQGDIKGLRDPNKGANQDEIELLVNKLNPTYPNYAF